jgi:hypothetical protein
MEFYNDKLYPDKFVDCASAMRSYIETTWLDMLMERGLNKDWEKDIPDKMYDCVNIYCNSDIYVHPIESEKHYITEDPVLITDKDKYWFQGYVDGILEIKGKRAKILDYKTSGRSWSEYKGENEIQPDFYGMLMGVNDLEMYYEIFVKTKVPKVERVVTLRNKKKIRRAYKLVREFVKGIENENFYPIKGMLCNPEYCGFYELCQKW